MSLFSHAPEPAPASLPERQEKTYAVYAELTQPFEAIWQGFTEYAHLWWPQALKEEADSYIEITPQLLLEQLEEGETNILGEVAHYVAGDLIALTPLEETAQQLYTAFPHGLSFTFELGDDTEPSVVEISSGIMRPRELDEDAELGITGRQSAALAQQLLTGFARFMGSPQAVKLEEL